MLLASLSKLTLIGAFSILSLSCAEKVKVNIPDLTPCLNERNGYRTCFTMMSGKEFTFHVSEYSGDFDLGRFSLAASDVSKIRVLIEKLCINDKVTCSTEEFNELQNILNKVDQINQKNGVLP